MPVGDTGHQELQLERGGVGRQEPQGRVPLDHRRLSATVAHPSELEIVVHRREVGHTRCLGGCADSGERRSDRCPAFGEIEVHQMHAKFHFRPGLGTPWPSQLSGVPRRACRDAFQRYPNRCAIARPTAMRRLVPARRPHRWRLRTPSSDGGGVGESGVSSSRPRVSWHRICRDPWPVWRKGPAPRGHVRTRHAAVVGCVAMVRSQPGDPERCSLWACRVD